MKRIVLGKVTIKRFSRSLKKLTWSAWRKKISSSALSNKKSLNSNIRWGKIEPGSSRGRWESWRNKSRLGRKNRLNWRSKIKVLRCIRSCGKRISTTAPQIKFTKIKGTTASNKGVIQVESAQTWSTWTEAYSTRTAVGQATILINRESSKYQYKITTAPKTNK